MDTKHFVLAASLLFSGVALAQNTTTAGDLRVRPTVTAPPGSILDQSRTPVHEHAPAASISDRDVKPAGAAIDATSTRRHDEQDLNVTTPNIPLGQTRASVFDNIDEKVPMGASDNSYRPSSASGYYDNAIEESKVRPVAPSVKPPPAPVDPIRPAAPQGDYNPPGEPD